MGFRLSTLGFTFGSSTEISTCRFLGNRGDNARRRLDPLKGKSRVLSGLAPEEFGCKKAEVTGAVKLNRPLQLRLKKLGSLKDILAVKFG